MAKFKKGDRVRVLRDGYTYKEGWTGVVDQNNSDVPYVKWDNGAITAADEDKLEIITKTNNMNNVKIAVSFENDSEKLAYLKYCERIGKVWRSGKNPLSYVSSYPIYAFDSYIYDEENVISTWTEKSNAEEDGYTIVPFKVFAALKGIDYKPEVTVKLNDQYTATILDGKVKVGCQEFEFERIEALHKAIQEAKK